MNIVVIHNIQSIKHNYEDNGNWHRIVAAIISIISIILHISIIVKVIMLSLLTIVKIVVIPNIHNPEGNHNVNDYY